ncbi:MAG: DUF945 family protein [Pseudomonadota bacterium]
MKKTGMVVGGVVLAAAVVAPWAVGMVTEQQWRQVTSEVNASQRFVRLETGEYQRGYLGGHFEGTLVVEDPAADKPLQLEYQARVSHGVTGSLMEFSPQDDLPEAARRLFTDEQPRLTLETRLWGTAIVELTVPAVSVANAQTGESLQMSGGFARADIDGAGSDADITLVWPGMTMSNREMAITLEELRLEQSLSHLRGEVWTGEGEAQIETLELSAPGQPALRFDGFNMTSRTWASDDDRRVNGETVATVETVTAGDERFGPHRVEFVLRELNVDSWSELTAALTDLQVAALDQGDSPAAFENQIASMNHLSEALLGLAADGFDIGFPDLSVMTPEGEVSGQAMLGHPALSKAERAQMLMVMQRLTGQLELSLPVALVDSYPALRMQLAPLIKQGMVVEQGDRLSLDAQLKDLALDVNGVIIPLPPLL